jgi:hypothetical protein
MICSVFIKEEPQKIFERYPVLKDEAK